MRRALMTAMTAVLLLGAVPVVQAHDAPKRCGRSNREWGPARYTQLRSHGGTGCTKARRLAKRYMQECYGDQFGCGRSTWVDYQFGGWTCKRDNTRHGARVRCVRTFDQSKVAHFKVVI